MDGFSTKEIIIMIFGGVQSVLFLIGGAYLKQLWSYLGDLKSEQSNTRQQIEKIYSRMNMLEVAITKIDVKQTTIEAALAMHLKTVERVFEKFQDEVKTQFTEFRSELRELREKK